MIASVTAVLASCSDAGEYRTVSTVKKAEEPKYIDENGVGYLENEQGGLKVITNQDKARDIVIPEKYRGKAVTEVAKDAFKMSKVKSVSLPRTVTQINDYTFAFCSSLNRVDIPDSVASIGTNAFSGCTSLKEITLPDSLYEIGIFSFYASGLETVTIPKSVEKIDEYAFARCGALRETVFEGKSVEIAQNAFSSCGNLKIKAPEDGDAIAYARENGIPYEAY